MRALRATSQHGFDVVVKLKGHHLHQNMNKTFAYVPPTTYQLQSAPTQTHPRGLRIRLNGRNLHYDSDEEDLPLDPYPHRIGFHSVHLFEDYKPKPRLNFPASQGYIDLGRYGPFRVEDRKKKLHSDIKSFIFSSGPEEWAFGVSENLFGQHDQVVDITNDATGRPHDLATKMIPMYVNEAGHTGHYKQNVFACEAEGNVVHYYFESNKEMKPGQTVELLTEYFSVYETIRVRKGYGKRNLAGLVQSDDHCPTRRRRNLDDRVGAMEDIDNLELFELYELLEFIETRIREPLGKALDAFLSAPDVPEYAPTVREWIAFRRIHWLKQFFKGAWDRIRSNETICMSPTAPFLLNQIFQSIESMEWTSFATFLKLPRSTKDTDGENVL